MSLAEVMFHDLFASVGGVTPGFCLNFMKRMKNWLRGISMPRHTKKIWFLDFLKFYSLQRVGGQMGLEEADGYSVVHSNFALNKFCSWNRSEQMAVPDIQFFFYKSLIFLKLTRTVLVQSELEIVVRSGVP